MFGRVKLKTVVLGILSAIFAIVFALSLFWVSGTSMGAEETAVAATTNYTLIRASYRNSTYRPYAGITTVGGLKKNLLVEGTTNNNQEFSPSDTYELLDGEYVIRIGGVNKADDDLLQAGDTNIIIACGTQTTDMVLEFAEEIPVLSGDLSVTSRVNPLTDDFTQDTVHKVLTVKVGETVLSPDLYTLSMGDIYNQTSASITVKVNEQLQAGLQTTITLPVTPARLLGAELRVSSEYYLGADNYYKYKDESGTERDAFVQGASQLSLFGKAGEDAGKIEIVAVFANGKRVLTPAEYNVQGELSAAITGEELTASGNTTGNSTITVSVKRGEDSASASLQINFAAIEIVKIEVNETALQQWNIRNATTTNEAGELVKVNDDGIEVHPYTTLNPADMKGDNGVAVFKLIRNDGTEETNLSQLRMDGTLVPDADTLAGDLSSGIYTKSVSFSVTNSNGNQVSVSIDVNNIRYQKPLSVSIEGLFTTQLKHHTFNHEGLTLTIGYTMKVGETSRTTYIRGVSLQDYVEHDGYVETKVLGLEETGNKVYNDSNYVEISVEFDGVKTTIPYTSHFTPANDRLDLPMTDLSVITFSDGCYKEFTGFDETNMSMMVYNDLACTQEATNGKRNGNRVEFTGGGTYYVKIALKDEELLALDGVKYPADEFELYYAGTTSSDITLDTNGRYAIYKIQINKGTLAVNVALNASEGGVHYGDDLTKAISVTGTSNGKTTVLGTENGQLNVSYQLVFVRKGQNVVYGTSLSYADCAYGYSAPTKINAGEYTVYAVTESSEAFLASKVREGKGISLTVLPAPIKTDTPATTQEYKREEYSLDTFFAASGFAAGEFAKDVFTKKGIQKDGVPVEKLLLAGSYTVTLELKENEEQDDYIYNYTWGTDSAEHDVALTITPKKFNNFKVTLDKNSYYYKEQDALVVTFTGGDDAYFTVSTATADTTYFDGTNTYTNKKLSELPIGDYTVTFKITPKLRTDLGETLVDGKPADFELPEATATFAVTAALLDRISADKDSSLGAYDPNGYEVAFSNWQDGAIAFGATAQSTWGGYTITDPTLDSSTATVKLTDAGTYTLTFTPQENYAWKGEEGGDPDNNPIEFTFKITRKVLREAALPSTPLTYNGEEQSVSVSNWDELKAVVTYSVNGISGAADGVSVTSTDGTFQVKLAGDYQVVFAINGDQNKNNYGWDENTVEDQKQHVTVNQAEIAVSWRDLADKNDVTSQDFNDATEVQTLDVFAKVIAFEGDNLTASFTVYKDFACTEKVPLNQITTARTYYLKVTGFDSTDSSKANYKLPESGNVLTYEIVSQALVIPVLVESGNGITVDNSGSVPKITVTYQGEEYFIWEFFTNRTAYTLGGVDGAKLQIIWQEDIQNKSICDATPNGYYEISIKPAGNYKWTNGTDTVYTYRVFVEPKAIEFKWTTTEFTFNGALQKPTASVETNLFDRDKGKVTVFVDDSARQTDAGAYEVPFDKLKLEGDNHTNYTLVSPASYNGSWKILRAQVATPVADKESAVFNETQQQVKFTLNLGNAACAVTPSATGFAADGSYSYSSGTFKFYHAGTYTVIFRLNSNNYCWEQSQTGVFATDTDFNLEYKFTFTVSPKPVTAPALEDDRAIELNQWNKDYKTDGVDFAAHFNSAYNGLNVSYEYGNYDNLNTVLSNFLGKDLERGVYFVKLTFAPDAEQGGYTPYSSDYAWEENTGDGYDSEDSAWKYLYNATNSTSFGKIEDPSIYLYFVITKSQVNATFEVKGYTFGDNGFYLEGGNWKHDKEFTAPAGGWTLDNISGSDFIEKVSADDFADYELIITFHKREDGSDDAISAGGLVNGLPWTKGTYYVKITVKFNEENSDYQTFANVYKFEVSQRPIVVTWDKNTFTYNGQGQAPTPTVTNLRYSTQSETEKPSLTVNYTGEEYGENVAPVDVNYKNGTVAAYKAEIVTVSGTNYTLTDGTGTTYSFTINPEELTIIAKNDIKYVYGDSLDFLTGFTASNYHTYYTVNAGTIHREEYDCIKLVLTDTAGNSVSGMPVVGGKYKVTPALVNPNGNYVIEMPVPANFTVAQRAITLTFTGGNESTYGEALNLSFTATSNGADDVRDGVYGVGKGADDVLQLYLQNNSTSETAEDGYRWTSVGEYAVKIRELDSANYTVEFAGTVGVYTVSAAEIKDVTVTPASDKVYKAEDYTLRELLAQLSAKTADDKAVTWLVSEKDPDNGAEWKPIDEFALKNAGDTQYWIKATCANHTDSNVQTVTVTINRKEITIALNLQIYFGEENPAESNFLGQNTSLNHKFYTIDELCENDKTNPAAVISGEIEYTTNYIAGSAAGGNYTVTITKNGFDSDNYQITAVTATLTVLALPVKVQFNDGVSEVSLQYWEGVGEAFPYGKFFTITPTVESTYGGTIELDFEEYGKIVTLSSDGVTLAGQNVIGTGDVKSYGFTLALSAENTGNYTFAEDSTLSGNLNVTPASFTANYDLGDEEQTFDYNEKKQGIEGAIEIGDVKNGQQVTVKYVYSLEELTSDEDILKLIADCGTEVSDLSQVRVFEFIDADIYYVYFTVTATNHETYLASYTIEITFVENSFIQGSFHFDGNWTYGALNSEKNNGGFDYDNNHGAQNAQTQFKRIPANETETNTVTYYLFRKADFNSVSVNTTRAFAHDTDFAALVREQFEEGAFTVGDYVIYYVMTGNNNYGTVSDYTGFTVLKRVLTVTPNAISVTYGEAAPATFNYTVTGYALVWDKAKGALVAETEGIAFGTNTIPEYECAEYTAIASGVGYYAITKKAGATEIGGYKVTYLDSDMDQTPPQNALHVIAREVEIVIYAQTSTFDYYNDANKDSKEPLLLTEGKGYKVVKGNFLTDADSVIQLYTSATLPYTDAELNKTFATNCVGDYPVFAVFANSEYAANYSVRVIDGAGATRYETAFTGDDKFAEFDASLVIGGGEANTAGVYHITRAKLKLTYNPGKPMYWDEEAQEMKEYPANDPNAYCYDGKHKGFVAGVTGMEGVTFQAQYGTSPDELDDEMPINAGTYYYNFKSNNKNFTWDTTGIDPWFEINKKVLAVTRELNGTESHEDEFTYNHEELALRFLLQGLVNEDANLQVSVAAKKRDEKFGDPFVSLETFKTLTDTGYTLKGAVNAGEYTVTVRLVRDSLLTFDPMSNYLLVDGNDVYTFTFTIKQATLNLTAQNSQIQYGTTLTGTSVQNDRFKGFALSDETKQAIDAEGNLFDISRISYNFVQYTASSPIGTPNCYITVNTNSVYSYNYKLTSNVTYDGQGVLTSGLLTVIPRQITVTVNGYTDEKTPWANTVYNGYSQTPAHIDVRFYSLPEDWAGDSGDTDFVGVTGTVLTLTKKAVNAGTYRMKVTSGQNTNYAVTFVNSDDTVLKADTAEGDLPVFNVARAPLTVGVVSTNGSSSYSLTYGESIENTYKIVYKGLAVPDGGSLNGGAADGYTGDNGLVTELPLENTTYAPWTTHAGTHNDLVKVSGGEFYNYEIVKYEHATVTVTARPVTVTTANRVYTEEMHGSTVIYNQGANGIRHIAPVIFTDAYGSVEFIRYATDGEYTDGAVVQVRVGGETYSSDTSFALTYSATGTAFATGAPTSVNKSGYVKIVLTGTDFVFDTEKLAGTQENPVHGTLTQSEAVFEYRVTPKELHMQYVTGVVTQPAPEGDFFQWKSESDAGNKYVEVNYHFVQELFGDISVQKLFGSTTETFRDGVLAGGGYYTISQDGCSLRVYPNGIGFYTVTVKLTEVASENYYWSGNAAAGTVQFTFAAKSLTIDALSIANWTYLQYSAEENAVVIENSAGLPATAFAFTYAKFTGTATEDDMNYKLVDGDLIAAVSTLTYGAALPTDADVYVLKAEYRGTGFEDTQYGTTYAYCLFKINKQRLAAPVFTEESETSGISYDASAHTAILSYGYRTMDYTFKAVNGNGDGVPVRTGDLLTLTATNADKYAFEFRLLDDKNYEWADGSTDPVSLTWEIVKSNNVVTVSDCETEYGDLYEISVALRFNGDVTIYYAVRGEEETPAANAVWRTETPQNAGKYWVRAVCAESKNFLRAESTQAGKLTVTRATIYASPFGSIVYGQNLNEAADIHVVYTGWKGNELSVTADKVEYDIGGYNGIPVVNEAGYKLIFAANSKPVFTIAYTEGADVFGIMPDNYTVEPEEGAVRVNKKDVTVTLGNLTVKYGEDFDATKVTLTQDSFAELVGADKESNENALAALRIKPALLRADKVNGYFNASAYFISSQGHEAAQNYNVTVRYGMFTVEKLDVYIEVDAGGGEFGNVKEAKVTHVYAGEGENRFDVEEKFGVLASPSFTFLYAGTVNGGANYPLSKNVPAHAGNYTATAVITNFVNNFNLLTEQGTPSVNFTVARKTIVESEISVAELKYNRQAQSPTVIDGKYFKLYETEKVSYTNVGDYTVKLTLKNANDYKWSSVEGSVYSLPFSIGKGDNAFVGTVTAEGWNFGDGAKTPQASTEFGNSAEYVYTYCAERDGEYTRTVPTAAGTYWVIVTAPESANYNAVSSDPVSFVIGKRALNAPTLEMIAQGAGANTVYTGERLKSVIENFDPVLMRIVYEGDLSSSGNMAVYAVNAGTYNVYFALNDTNNYTWASDTPTENGNAVAVWTVARKKIEKPTMPSGIYMVNGGTLTFTPDGFDENTMTIADNTTSYGGVFKVTVSIKDAVNFEWIDGSVGDVTFDWSVVGWDTVFIIVVSVLGVCAGIAGIAVGIQYGVHKKKKRAEAAKQAAAEELIAQTVEQNANAAQNGSEGGNVNE